MCCVVLLLGGPNNMQTPDILKVDFLVLSKLNFLQLCARKYSNNTLKVS